MNRPAKCGTDSGYHHHLKTAKTEPCAPCRKAHAERWRELKANPRGKCPCGTQLRTDFEYCSRCRRKLDRAAKRGEQLVEPEPPTFVRRGAILVPARKARAA